LGKNEKFSQQRGQTRVRLPAYASRFACKGYGGYSVYTKKATGICGIEKRNRITENSYALRAELIPRVGNSSIMTYEEHKIMIDSGRVVLQMVQAKYSLLGV